MVLGGQAFAANAGFGTKARSIRGKQPLSQADEVLKWSLAREACEEKTNVAGILGAILSEWSALIAPGHSHPEAGRSCGPNRGYLGWSGCAELPSFKSLPYHASPTNQQGLLTAGWGGVVPAGN